MNNFILSLLIALPFVGNTQNQQTVDFLGENVIKNPIQRVDSANIYVGDGEFTDLFYYSISPKDSILGTLVLFPPTWQPVDYTIYINAQIIEQAYAEGILVIVPSINYNLYLDEFSLSFLNQAFTDVLEKFAPPKDKIVFGGFSLGGMNAIRYTEMAYENDSLTVVKPIAVYGVDPPLDLARLYRSFERAIEKNFSEAAVFEAKTYLEKMNEQFGGSPEEVNNAYVRHSMFSKSEKDGGNAQYLTSVPVRMYCDPDIDWHLRERRVDYSDMNAIDQTAMINQLLLKGNEEAEFVNVLGKGYRTDGRRHPHSWSLVDPAECIEWILKCIE